MAPAIDRFSRSDWVSSFSNVEQELTQVRLFPTQGVIPSGLLGTSTGNGPGRLERGGQRVHHPFDGDGMITIRFDQHSVSLTNRFVRTDGWMKEEAAGQFLYRGVFGSRKPEGSLQMLLISGSKHCQHRCRPAW